MEFVRLLQRSGWVAAFACVVLAGCAGRGDQEDEPDPTPRPAEFVDSSSNFAGKERAVAGAVEQFERAVRRGWQAKICREITLPRRGSFGIFEKRAVPLCLKSEEFSPSLELKTVADEGAYDLVVREVEIDPVKGQFKPDASALVAMPAGGPVDQERFGFQLWGGTWRLTERSAVGLVDAKGPGVLRCADGTDPKALSTDLFGGGEKDRLISARRTLLSRQVGDLGLGVPELVQAGLEATDQTDLARTELSYLYGGVSYELRDEAGDAVARFDLESFDGDYQLWRQEHCPATLKRAGFGG